MSYPSRPQSPSILLHAINRGNAKQTVFRENVDFQFYLGLLRRYTLKYDIRLYHFALIPNHIHLLLEATRKNTISKFMQGITLAYSMYFNAKYKSVGHLWQSRFRSIPIETDGYYLRCARYIELNPVRAQLVQHPANYPWSSYKTSIFHNSLSWIDTHPLLAEFQKATPVGTNPYQLFVEQELELSLNHANESFSKQAAYGEKGFIKQFQT